MIRTEFNDWVKQHMAAFGGLAEWLKSHQDSIDAWRDCLGDVPFDAACEATRRLNRGEEEPPRAFGDHARAVRRLALELRHKSTEGQRRQDQFIDGERVVSCHDCMDTGWVICANIWITNHGGTPIKAFLEGTRQDLPQCAVGCNCESRDPRTKTSYDSKSMFRIEQHDSDESNAEEFRRWWSEGRQTGRRENAFDAFNKG